MSLRWTVLAIALIVSVDSAWAGQPPASVPGAPPVVVRAAVDQLEPDRLVIRGTNFGAESAPIVLLANVPLEVLSFSDEQIVAHLPLDAPPARYSLRVFANGKIASDSVEVTIGRRRPT